VSVVAVENPIPAAGLHPLPDAFFAVKDSRKLALLTRAGSGGMPMAEALWLGPQRKLSQLAVRQLPSTFFRAGFFLHHAQVLLQGHRLGAMQSLLTASQAVGRKHFV
jgi:hypothetical protein